MTWVLISAHFYLEIRWRYCAGMPGTPSPYENFPGCEPRNSLENIQDQLKSKRIR
jgi:hypothetical protein